MSEAFPRRFGNYLLTAPLGEDALGRVYRAIRLSGERAFFRLRVMEGPEISEDPLLDAIEENGEVHGFLKNPAITRGVAIDAVDGAPFIAFQEDNGRTLDDLLDRARATPHAVPYEHALLIAEKIATALEHAHNTTVEGERTPHGLVWPGFVSISDDGETRLTGFGLAAGFFPSFSRPRFALDVAPFLAPEELAEARIGRNSDVYSVGAILFALLMGRPPNTADPLLDLKTARREGAPLAPDVAAVLRMCLGPAETRYASAGELRRELGKLHFSGPYAPSTFNLAFFLNSLFSAQIESETNARLREARLDAGGGEMKRPRGDTPPRPLDRSAAAPPARTPTAPSSTRPNVSVPARAPISPRERTPAAGTAAEPLPPLEPPHRSRRPPDAPAAPPPPRRGPIYLGGGLLVAAAVIGSAYLLFRRSPPAPAPPPAPTAIPATATPEPANTPAGPTSAMTDGQFKEEVARRVAQELKKMETEARRTTPVPPPDTVARKPADVSVSPTRVADAADPAAAAASNVLRSDPPPTTAPPVRPAAVEAAPEASEPPARAASRETAPAPEVVEVQIAPKILRVVKPIYPAVALRARIGGVVLLRVLVSETGTPAEIQVIKGVAGGLTESAVAAVKSWRFSAATHNGIATPAWTTVPIPFEP